MAYAHASHKATHFVEQTLQLIDKLFARFWAELERRAQPTQRLKQETQKGLGPEIDGHQTGAKHTQQAAKPKTSPHKLRATGAPTPQRTHVDREQSATSDEHATEPSAALLASRCWTIWDLEPGVRRSWPSNQPGAKGTPEKPSARSKYLSWVSAKANTRLIT
ncbi:Hypothetical predicted protein [Pelobates cultripes]|uniref:Uncharacterized protein n=1 Tax=Pelobates cultripes TaxID=61616 RepID=A0AAD1T4Z1_PELCU|nr:Hypothetical predicted protein [Pelobates cultripes]